MLNGTPPTFVIAISVRCDSTSASQHERSIHAPSPVVRAESTAATIASAAYADPNSFPQLVNVQPSRGSPSIQSRFRVSANASMLSPCDGRVRVRAGLAEAGDRAHHELGPLGPQGCEVDAEARPRTGELVLHDHVGDLGEPEERRSPLVAAKVEGDRSLAPVLRHVLRALAVVARTAGWRGCGRPTAVARPSRRRRRARPTWPT